ncbi:hypothetical protein AC1031_005530 [Aphanomyces cochlioides]|nr:hypothetical protein AC1031_005530 [Aphanomyces cochlioides]
MKLATITLALSAVAHYVVGARLCNSLTPYSYTSAQQQYPELANAIELLKANPVASWYTDRGTNPVADVLARCTSAVPVIVIYGLPNKDCGEGGFSNGGDNKNTDMYRAWVQNLVNQVGQREVIYILEPDAVGNLRIAMGLLSSNANAHIYVDVASWANQGGAISILNDLKSYGRLAGIAINTSNYRTTREMESLCQSYSSAAGGLRCVIDTSRNYNGSPNGEWCNARTGGIGSPPTDQPGNSLVDYHLWIKVPGESDGECTGQSSDAMLGPSAGSFFYDGFKTLWNQGYYGKKLGYPQIGQPWPNPTSAPTTQTPTTRPPVTTAPTSLPTTRPPVTPSPPSPPITPPLTTLPTSNPTVVPTTTPSSGGTAQPYAQCGGNNYSGPKNCPVGFVCSYNNEWYSQCLPGGSVVDTWGQCGGNGYTGPATCKPTDHCQYMNDVFSQCVPN